MKTFLTNLRKTAVAGFFCLLPLFVIIIILNKAWTMLTSVGARIAAMFGVKSVVGIGASTLATSILLILLFLGFGLLVRFSFMKAFSRGVENTLLKYIPGYQTYKAIAEEKLQSKARILPYTSALIKQQDCWQPAYIVEKDNEGNYVMFLPNIPETNKGQLLLAKQDQVKLVSSVSANELDELLKKMGKGLLAEMNKTSLMFSAISPINR